MMTFTKHLEVTEHFKRSLLLWSPEVYLISVNLSLVYLVVSVVIGVFTLTFLLSLFSNPYIDSFSGAVSNLFSARVNGKRLT